MVDTTLKVVGPVLTTFLQNDVLFPNVFAEPLGRFGPNEKIDSKGKIAFLKRLLQFTDISHLLIRRKNHHIQIGIRSGSPLGAGTIGPNLDAGNILFQQIQNDLSLPRGNVEAFPYFHTVSVIVW